MRLCSVRLVKLEIGPLSEKFWVHLGRKDILCEIQKAEVKQPFSSFCARRSAQNTRGCRLLCTRPSCAGSPCWRGAQPAHDTFTSDESPSSAALTRGQVYVSFWDEGHEILPSIVPIKQVGGWGRGEADMTFCPSAWVQPIPGGSSMSLLPPLASSLPTCPPY